VYENNDFADTIYTYRKESDPVNGTTTLTFPTRVVTVQYTSEEESPQPPEPVARVGLPAEAGTVTPQQRRTLQDRMLKALKQGRAAPQIIIPQDPQKP